MAARKRRKKNAGQDLAIALAALPGLSLDELKERWLAVYGNPPPPRLGRKLMVRAIAYRLQELALGGLKPTVRRQLDRTAEALQSGQPLPLKAPSVKPGTRLLREWQGHTHEVIVLEDGVQYQDRTYRSLSAVAREITGARWSGPRFFGLRGADHG